MYLKAKMQKKFEEFELDVELEARRGELVTLLGPSGSGKTSVLMLLAGLLPPDEARITIAGEDITNFPPEKRNFGMVFQEKLLFPHLNVFENVAFGVRMHGGSMADVRKALEAVGLEKFSRRSVRSLSGGEKQRVAIARAISYSPRLLLFDEPLKELDAVVKGKIKGELKHLQRRLRTTLIYVTHDVEEAFYLSDKIYLLHEGQVVQGGRPLSVFNNPANSFVKNYFSPYLLIKRRGSYFLGNKTALSAK